LTRKKRKRRDKIRLIPPFRLNGSEKGKGEKKRYNLLSGQKGKETAWSAPQMKRKQRRYLNIYSRYKKEWRKEQKRRGEGSGLSVERRKERPYYFTLRSRECNLIFRGTGSFSGREVLSGSAEKSLSVQIKERPPGCMEKGIYILPRVKV